MNLTRGFQLDSPEVFIPWDVSQAGLRKCLGWYRSLRLKKTSEGEYIYRCKSLGGLSHYMVFRFIPTSGDNLAELAFYKKSDFGTNWSLFQRHLEGAFGEPTTRDGKLDCSWEFDGVHIRHVVRERIGPEELVTITRTSNIVKPTTIVHATVAQV